MNNHVASRPFSVSCLIVSLACAGTVRGAEPPPRLPAKEAVAYLEYDGLDAHKAAWDATAARALFDKTPAGAMSASIARQVFDRVLQIEPDLKLKGDEVLGLLDTPLRRGFALALYDHGAGTSSYAVVFKGLGRADARQRIARLVRPEKKDGEEGDQKPDAPPVRLRGRDVFQVADAPTPKAEKGEDDDEPIKDKDKAKDKKKEPEPPPVPGFSWWFEKDDLVIVAGPSAAAEGGEKKDAPSHAKQLEAVLDALDGKAPDMGTHAGFRAASDEGKDLAGVEPDGLFFIETAGAAGLFNDLQENPVLNPFGLPGFSASRRNGYERMTLPAGFSPHDARSFPAPAGAVPYLPAISPPPPSYGALAPIAPSGAALPSGYAAPAPIAPSIPAPVPAPIAPSSAAPVPAPIAPVSVSAAPRPAPRIAASPYASLPVPVGTPVTPPGDDVVRVAAKPAEPDLDMTKLFGFDGVKRVIGRWGFQGKGLVTDVRIEMPAPRKGMLALVDQPGFRKDKLPPIPKEVRTFVVGSFDPKSSADRLLALVKQAGPEAKAQVEQMEQALREVVGLKLTGEAVAQLGPSWCWYDLAENAETAYTMRGQVLVVGLHNADAFAKALDAAAQDINEYLHNLENGKADAGDRKQPADPPVYALERLPAPERGYQLNSPAGLSLWIDDDIRPTVLVGQSYVVVASNPDLARAALTGATKPEAQWVPSGELAATFAGLPRDLTSLSVADTSGSFWPQAIVHLPGYVQLLGNLIEAQGEEDDDFPGASLLGLAGVPRPGKFRIRLTPAQRPKATDLKAHFFPSVLATTVDDRGLRWVGREAFPLAGLPGEVPLSFSVGPDFKLPLNSKLKLNLNTRIGGK